MTSCKNCGYKSHCGIEHRQQLLAWSIYDRDELLGEIIVCNHCRCELCIEVTWRHMPGV
jgi:hypothetical protein